MADLLKPAFNALVAYASVESERAQSILSGILKRNSDLAFDDLLDARKTSEIDMELVRARIEGIPLAFPEGHDVEVLKMSLSRLLENEGFVSHIGEWDSSGGDIMQAYAVLFGKNPIITICENQKYLDHPWITFHSHNVVGSPEKFEEHFREMVNTLRLRTNSKTQIKLERRAEWMKKFLYLPVKPLGNKISLYLAHATTHMKEVREFQKEFEMITGEEIKLQNPYYELPGTDRDREIEADRKLGKTLELEEDFDEYVVLKDVEQGIIESDGIIVFLNRSPLTIGREMELVYGMLSGKQIMFGVCTDPALYHHPLIRAHLDEVIFYDENTSMKEIAKDATEKLTKLIEKRKFEGKNKRVENYRKMIRENLITSDENGAARI